MRFKLRKSRLNESVKSFGDIIICDYVGNIKDILLNKPANYRILYVPEFDLYILGDTYSYVHPDLLVFACRKGYCALPFVTKDYHKAFYDYDNQDLDDIPTAMRKPLYEYIKNCCVRYIFVSADDGYYEDEDNNVPFATLPTGEVFIKEEDMSRANNDSLAKIFKKLSTSQANKW